MTRTHHHEVEGFADLSRFIHHQARINACISRSHGHQVQLGATGLLLTVLAQGLSVLQPRH